MLRIVTDSTCDLPREAIQSLGITVVPLSILFGEEELLDGVDIQADQFFRRLERDPNMPRTSQPSPVVCAWTRSLCYSKRAAASQSRQGHPPYVR